MRRVRDSELARARLAADAALEGETRLELAARLLQLHLDGVHDIDACVTRDACDCVCMCVHVIAHRVCAA